MNLSDERSIMFLAKKRDEAYDSKNYELSAELSDLIFRKIMSDIEKKGAFDGKSF